MVRYYSTACNSEIVSVYHQIMSSNDWKGSSAKENIKSWLETNEFKSAKIKDNTYTHAGVACGCSTFTGYIDCIFMFASNFLPKKLTHWVPRQLPYLQSGNCEKSTICPTINDAFTNTDTKCTSTQFADPEKGCTECSTRHPKCSSCKYRGAQWSSDKIYRTMVECTACSNPLKSLDFEKNGKFCADKDCVQSDKYTGRCTGCLNGNFLKKETNTCQSPGSCGTGLVDNKADSRCDCESGKYMNVLYNKCFACTQIDPQCATCKYDEQKFYGLCETCKPGYALSTDKLKCVSTLANCKTKKTGDPSKCSICDTGYFLKTDEKCHNCTKVTGALTNCLTCTFEASKSPHLYNCDTCAPNKVLAIDKQSCGDPPANCEKIGPHPS